MNRLQTSLWLMFITGLLSANAGCSKTPSAAPRGKSKTVTQQPRRVLPAKSADNIRVETGGRRFTHTLSQTMFQLPDGWNSDTPKGRGKVEFIKITDTKSTAKALITWTPLESTLENAAQLRFKSLRRAKSYGEENVSAPKSVTIGPKTGWRIDLKVGLGKNRKEREIIYHFATAPGTRSLWKIVIRVTLDANADDAVARKLVNQFTWVLP